MNVQVFTSTAGLAYHRHNMQGADHTGDTIKSSVICNPPPGKKEASGTIPQVP
jgi:hypothetical protein